MTPHRNILSAFFFNGPAIEKEHSHYVTITATSTTFGFCLTDSISGQSPYMLGGFPKGLLKRTSDDCRSVTFYRPKTAAFQHKI